MTLSLKDHLRALVRLQKTGVPDDLIIRALDYTPSEILEAWCDVVERAAELALDKVTQTAPVAAPETSTATNLMKAEPDARAYRSTRGQRAEDHPAWVKDEVARMVARQGGYTAVQRRFGIGYESAKKIERIWKPSTTQGIGEIAGFGPDMPMHLLDGNNA